MEPRLIPLTEQCFINMDDHSFVNGEKKVPIPVTDWRFVQKLIENPNRLMTFGQLTDAMYDDGCVSRERIIKSKNRVKSKAAQAGIRIDDFIVSKRGEGYVFYSANPLICSVETQCATPSTQSFVDTTTDWIERAVNSAMSCRKKWGPFSDDEEKRNANVCEGAICLLMAGYTDGFDSAIREINHYLDRELSATGLISKSLKYSTVVPTSMCLHFVQASRMRGRSFAWKNESAAVDALWEARDRYGWGMYVMRSPDHANIGSTFWALRALKPYTRIAESEEFEATIERLYHFNHTGLFRFNVSDGGYTYNLYSTAMMFIISNEIAPHPIPSDLYQSEKALEFILDKFDSVNYLAEKEEIKGVDRAGTVTVNNVSWTHCSFRYALEAIGLAYSKNMIDDRKMASILERVSACLAKHSVSPDRHRTYWNDLADPLEAPRRGYRIYPTMNTVSGLCYLLDCLGATFPTRREKRCADN